MHHPQIVQSPIVNDFLKVKIDDHTEPQLVPKMLLQVSVRELCNNLVRNIDDGGIKDARDAKNHIIISDSTLRSLLPTQFKKCRQDTRSCVVVRFVYLPKVYIPYYYHGVIVIKKKLRIKSRMLKIEGLGGNQIIYMKHIKIQSCHMGVIFMPKHLICQRKKCVHIYSQIMY